MVIRNPFDSLTVKKIEEIIEPYLSEIKEKSVAKYVPDWEDKVSEESLLSLIDYEVPKGRSTNLSRVSVDKPAKEIKKLMKELFPDLDIYCSGTFFYPNSGYMSWHTNQDMPTDRLYITYSSEQGKSFFRYYKDGKVFTDYDDKGLTVRRFTATGTKPYFWHCVGSSCDRVSIGFQLSKIETKPFLPMATYAIVKDEIVTNVVEWNGDLSIWSPPEGTIAVLAEKFVGIGDSYINHTFTSTNIVGLGYDQEWIDVRATRNQLLAETDWWASSDLTMSKARKEYRQALRDLPSTVSSPEEVTWPIKPT